MKRVFALFMLVALVARAVVAPAGAVRGKFNSIQTCRARRGSTFVFTAADLNAYAQSELPRIAPQGVRQLRLELREGGASGYAMIDFLKLRHAQGSETPWLISKLIEGERPVQVDAHIRSGNGRATVYLDRVEISGVAVSGSTLDFLIRTFFLPLYPNAKIDQPFELTDCVDRIEVSPGQARVVLRK